MAGPHCGIGGGFLPRRLPPSGPSLFRVDRNLPMMKQLSAMLALLVAMLAGLPGAAAAGGQVPANVLAEGGAGRADTALPAAARQKAARGAAEADKDGDGGGDPAPLAAAAAFEALDGGACASAIVAPAPPQRRCASYRSRAPPAA